MTSILVTIDSDNYCTPQETENGTPEQESLGILVDFLCGVLPLMHRWYVKFLCAAGANLVHGNNIELVKTANRTVILRYIDPGYDNLRLRCFSVPITELMRLMGEWCDFVRRGPLQILVTCEGGKVALIPQVLLIELGDQKVDGG